ncbi:MAG TPA: tyrosine-protein phosphatase [Anaerovoracaceae bacterium]|nr:tyrosine-protein phosphatase [Anaerovoracaceae bacterium]HYE68341.1 tyrosine-protein phosphatase [Anaerovoracaceae bacterium]
MTGKNNKQPITLERALNTRDLGGYITADGRKTTDVFLRGDSLEILSARDKDTLLDLGVRTVIDLRNNDEILRTPSIFVDCSKMKYYNIPILPEDSQEKFIRQSGYAFLMGDLYISILEKSRGAFCKVFRILAEADGKVLYHCSSGKDRTGVVSALLLKLVNIDDQAVIEDYCLTEVLMEEKLSIMKAEAKRMEEYPDDFLDEVMSAKAHTMAKFLEHLENNWNGAEAYLRAIGLCDDEITRLKVKMTEDEEKYE